MHRVGGDLRNHILLGEVEGLLVLQVNVYLRVLTPVDLAVFRAFPRCCIAYLELHFVLISQLVAGLLCA